MGQFLAIGLATRVSAKKTEVDKSQLDIEQLQEEMKAKLYYAPEIYVANDNNDSYYEFILKDDVLYPQLIPFLKTIYPLLYEKSVYYDDIIEKLEGLPPSEWLPWAEEKPEEAFQMDEYGTWDYLEKNHSSIQIYYDSLLLSMEGKISMESFGRQFRFFKYTMMQTFKQFGLSEALRVYITG
uniref:Uncharacterized protein n=2 Tax=unclassified Candidatus Kentrum TaxID=2643149 RepID=A0A451AT10_9GAMM|nr:MAG: hypothetical protein BECKLPF1236B_GA0070989_11542 [Candidatus Kentron sp. LPFa]VFK67810.1 MAG: hypothetical protein BECKUNK1418G_GA0071005_11674 [Candidatus Kentron sp. UNK]VFK69153.1 MAG: hypothetical protein BECKUNK1418H_GA0071006_10114 [Candidatus Kentron sp. UNK]